MTAAGMSLVAASGSACGHYRQANTQDARSGLPPIRARANLSPAA